MTKTNETSLVWIKKYYPEIYEQYRQYVLDKKRRIARNNMREIYSKAQKAPK